MRALAYELHPGASGVRAHRLPAWIVAMRGHEARGYRVGRVWRFEAAAAFERLAGDAVARTGRRSGLSVVNGSGSRAVGAPRLDRAPLASQAA